MMTERFFTNLATLVEEAAEMRNEPPVPRQFIEEALALIDGGQETASQYPTGQPSRKEVYDLAAELERTAAAKN